MARCSWKPDCTKINQKQPRKHRISFVRNAVPIHTLNLHPIIHLSKHIKVLLFVHNTAFHLGEPLLPEGQHHLPHFRRQLHQFCVAIQQVLIRLLVQIEQERIAGAEKRHMCRQDEA